jgi:hypothetical protein
MNSCETYYVLTDVSLWVVTGVTRLPLAPTPPCSQTFAGSGRCLYTVKPVLNGISRVQNIFLRKPGFRLIKLYYDSHGT